MENGTVFLGKQTGSPSKKKTNELIYLHATTACAMQGEEFQGV